MSTYYDLYCLDCEKRAWILNTKDDAAVAEIWRFRTALAALSRSQFEITFGAGSGVPTWWIETHLDHNVHVQSEYGDLDTDCGELFERGYCRRSKAHDGSHSRKRDYKPPKL